MTRSVAARQVCLDHETRCYTHADEGRRECIPRAGLMEEDMVDKHGTEVPRGRPDDVASDSDLVPQSVLIRARVHFSLAFSCFLP